MTVVVVLLTAAAVLAWPTGYSVGRFAQRQTWPDEVVLPGAGSDGAGNGTVFSSSGGTGAEAAAGTGARTVGTGAGVRVADLAGVIDLLALTLRGGVGVVEAMEAVADRVGGLLGMHLRTVAAASRWGVDDARAWASVPSAWQPVARALRMAATAGVPPADVLLRAAEQIRRSEQQRLEVATATLGVRIVLPLGLAFLPAFVLTTVVPVVLALARHVLVDPV